MSTLDEALGEDTSVVNALGHCGFKLSFDIRVENRLIGREGPFSGTAKLFFYLELEDVENGSFFTTRFILARLFARFINCFLDFVTNATKNVGQRVCTVL